MHYRNGREAKNGDKIVRSAVTKGADVVAVWRVAQCRPRQRHLQRQHCTDPKPVTGACLCDCLHADDSRKCSRKRDSTNDPLENNASKQFDQGDGPE
jgi:hypothetical protein